MDYRLGFHAGLALCLAYAAAAVGGGVGGTAYFVVILATFARPEGPAFVETTLASAVIAVLLALTAHLIRTLRTRIRLTDRELCVSGLLGYTCVPWLEVESWCLAPWPDFAGGPRPRLVVRGRCVRLPGTGEVRGGRELPRLLEEKLGPPTGRTRESLRS